MARPKRRSPQSKAPRDPAGRVVLLAATPLLVGGAIALTMAMSSANSPMGRWLKSMFRGGTRTRAIRDRLVQYARGEQPFSSLRIAIIGSAKGAVKAVFGP